VTDATPASARDPAALARALIRCPSVTPEEGGALTLLEKVLNELGFTCHRLVFSEDGTAPVDNLYARLGTNAPHLCFAGHTDVVPVGDTSAWTVDPFGGEVRDGCLFGRGASDMKGAIAAFIAAASRKLAEGGGLPGSISLLITGDEEGPAVNGTVKMLDWLAERGEALDHCLVGEPTSARQLGDTVKIGRRGAMNGRITIHGTQGHAAYPDLADNPLHHLVRMLSPLVNEPLDSGTEHFQPSSLQITSIDVGNTATNVIPAKGVAVFDCRFNSLHGSRDIERWMRERLDRNGTRYDMDIRVSGESFLSPPGRWSNLIGEAVRTVTGHAPELSTSGGTSDARFIKDYCTVAELGMLNATAHKIDEHVSLEDIEILTGIYWHVIQRYFAT
jgi:succinyl-diaminopimelate desuccinylase